jgi:hypothetical protein
MLIVLSLIAGLAISSFLWSTQGQPWEFAGFFPLWLLGVIAPDLAKTIFTDYIEFVLLWAIYTAAVYLIVLAFVAVKSRALNPK